MTYEEALEYIHSLPTFSGTIDFEKTNILMEYLGSPQKDLKCIHIAGTNGKGSTAAFISRILMEAGFKVGLYTSPYIERFTERIRIGDTEINEAQLTELTKHVSTVIKRIREASLPLPTEFDVITAIAFLWFRKMGTDIAVIETGMGGRLDSTNVIISPELCVITSISFDHMAVLGNTLPEIAYEKAGIIKEGSDVLLYPQSPEVYEVFEKKCKEMHAGLHDCVLGTPGGLLSGMEGQLMDIDLSASDDPALHSGFKGRGLTVSLIGPHQINNASMALNASVLLRSRGWDIPDSAILAGLSHTIWAGRFEILQKHPFFIIDGGHNADGVEKLASSLKACFPGKKIIFIFGVLEDKDYPEMTGMILPLAKTVFTVTVPNPRTLSAAGLASHIKNSMKEAIPVIPCADISAAVSAARDLASPDDVICAFGSLYYIGIVRSLFI